MMRDQYGLRFKRCVGVRIIKGKMVDPLLSDLNEHTSLANILSKNTPWVGPLLWHLFPQYQKACLFALSWIFSVRKRVGARTGQGDGGLCIALAYFAFYLQHVDQRIGKN